MLMLLRLVPFVEANYNLIELGPRETGKSYAYQQLSPYSILMTGPTTVANLFFNTAKSAWWDCGTPSRSMRLRTWRKCPRKS